MSQVIKIKRGGISGLSGASTVQGELIIATGSLGNNVDGPFLLAHGDSLGLVAGAIFTGSSVPTITDSELNGILFYDDANSKFIRLDTSGNQSLDIEATGFSGDTDGVSEGSTNLYYTDARVKTKLNTENVLSGSAPNVLTFLNVEDGATNYGDDDVKTKLNTENAVSGSASDVRTFLNVADGVTNYGDANVKSKLNTEGAISSSAQIASDISGSFTAGSGISLSNGEFSVAAGTGLTQGATGLSFDADGGTLTTSNADVDHILINDNGTFKRIAKSNINVGDFNNDAGYATGDNFDADGTFASLRAQGTTAGDVGLGNVTNESKATMFASPTFTGTVSGVTKSHVGLGNVTNESKATMFTNAALTGNPTAPTQTATDSSTKIATTAFVKAKLNNENVISGSAMSPTFAGLTVTGNASIQGTLTTVNSNDVNIGDRIITLNTADGAGDAGIQVHDTNGAQTGSLLWDTDGDYWKVGVVGGTDYRLVEWDGETAGAGDFIVTNADGRIDALATSTAGDMLISDGDGTFTVTNVIDGGSY